ncbi:sensor histidine kinase [Nocardioides szechwanensis]|nr:sensor histidine kinase [Nocardioides szechwanensis]
MPPRRSADAALVGASFLASVLVFARNGQDSAFRTFGDVPLPAYLVFAVAAVALLGRRRQPVAVFAVVLACAALSITFDFGHVGVATLVSLYSVGRYSPGRVANGLVVASALGFAMVDALTADATVADAVGGALVTVLVWSAGLVVRQRAERAALLVREQAAQESRVLAEERTRIARELHDVVAHGVSLMTVQAGAAKTVARVDPEGAVQAMAAVEQAGRQALGELRHLLQVLRPDSADGELGPQPGLADVPRLVSQLGEAGLHVSLDADPAPPGLPGRVDLFAFRIVQEALTNALKHAGPGTSVAVGIRVDHRAMTIDVADDGPGSQVRAGSGHGLVGMRERTQLLGGSLQAGPRSGGGFQVLAVLPLGDGA